MLVLVFVISVQSVAGVYVAPAELLLSLSRIENECFYYY